MQKGFQDTDPSEEEDTSSSELFAPQNTQLPGFGEGMVKNPSPPVNPAMVSRLQQSGQQRMQQQFSPRPVSKNPISAGIGSIPASPQKPAMTPEIAQLLASSMRMEQPPSMTPPPPSNEGAMPFLEQATASPQWAEQMTRAMATEKAAYEQRKTPRPQTSNIAQQRGLSPGALMMMQDPQTVRNMGIVAARLQSLPVYKVRQWLGREFMGEKGFSDLMKKSLSYGEVSPEELEYQQNLFSTNPDNFIINAGTEKNKKSKKKKAF